MIGSPTIGQAMAQPATQQPPQSVAMAPMAQQAQMNYGRAQAPMASTMAPPASHPANLSTVQPQQAPSYNPGVATNTPQPQQQYGQQQYGQQPTPDQWQQFQAWQQAQQQQGGQYGGQQGPMQGAHGRMAMQQQNPMLGMRPAPQMSYAQPYAQPPVQAPNPGAAYGPPPLAHVLPPPPAPMQSLRAPVAPGAAVGASAAELPGQRVGASAAEHPGLAMSDATQKTIEQKTLADAFLDHMRPYSYRYKNAAMEPRVSPTGGVYLGVMAQDLERIPHLGPQLVVDTPHGKMVDQKTALSATMAGLARVAERLSAVEHDLTKGRR